MYVIQKKDFCKGWQSSISEATTYEIDKDWAIYDYLVSVNRDAKVVKIFI